MNKIEQWLNAIINEDGHKMSAGSLRTIEMIRRELARPQNLQQTVCYTGLGEVERLLSKELEKEGDGFETYKLLEENTENQRALRRVMKLIKERQANAV